MKLTKMLLMVSMIIITSGCTTLVTAPIEVTGAVVSSTFKMVGAAGGAVVNTVTGGSSDKDDD